MSVLILLWLHYTTVMYMLMSRHQNGGQNHNIQDVLAITNRLLFSHYILPTSLHGVVLK
jgi:NADH:ubiquinone oxidoreductase subunit 6 (subunit J)